MTDQPIPTPASPLQPNAVKQRPQPGASLSATLLGAVGAALSLVLGLGLVAGLAGGQQSAVAAPPQASGKPTDSGTGAAGLPPAAMLAPLAAPLTAPLTPQLLPVTAPATLRNSVASFDCLTEPRQTVELRSPVEGLIAQVLTDRGAWVKRGQVLVVLDSQVEQATLAQARHRSQMAGRINQARNRVAYAQTKLARAEQLVRDNFLSAQARDEAATELKLAESDLQDALEGQQQAQLDMARTQQQIRQRTLTAPFDGYVVDRLLNPGDLAEAGTGRKAILKLAQLDPLRVEVVLPQGAFGKVTVGGQATVRAEGGAAPQQARVMVVDRVIDAASGTFGVRLELPNRSGKLPAGQRCKVEFDGLGGR